MHSKNLAKATTIVQKGLTFEIVRKTRLFPPFEILNSFFECGVDDAASEVTLHWEPFTLQTNEYEQLFDFCICMFGDLEIDKLGAADFGTWFSIAIDR